jgi:hypothetical protein
MPVRITVMPNTKNSLNASGNVSLTTQDIVYVDATAAPYTVTLPAAAGYKGKTKEIIKIDASVNTVTVTDGSVTFILYVQGEFISVTSSGTAWWQS